MNKILGLIIAVMLTAFLVTTTANAVPNSPADIDIASIPIGGLFYVPYTDNYTHCYKVVFRTTTDTYLMGMYSYKTCEWKDITAVCKNLESEILIDCNMVGAPSLEDLKTFIDSEVFIPATTDFWTTTPTKPNSAAVKIRNTKGSNSAELLKTEKCGICAIIRVSTSQNEKELLSSSYLIPNEFNGLKARLEFEESQYNILKSMLETGITTQEAKRAYSNALKEYNESASKCNGEVAIKGDANGDGKINAADATEILKFVVGLRDFSGTTYSNVDLNLDGLVNLADATEVLKIVIGLF